MAKIYAAANLTKDFVDDKVYTFNPEWLDNIVEMISESIERTLRLAEKHTEDVKSKSIEVVDPVTYNSYTVKEI